jgi:salicylate hydroxylase
MAEALAAADWDIPAALRRYERLRRPRTSRLQAMSTVNKTRFRLSDGPNQRLRDEQMASDSADWSFDAVAWIYEDAAAVDPTHG